MGWFHKRKPTAQSLYQEARRDGHPFSAMDRYLPLAPPEERLYESLREGIPLIDAGILKLVRLAGGFTVTTTKEAQRLLDTFLERVPSGDSGRGLQNFLDGYLDNLLTFGNAIGEMVLTRDGRFAGLYLADPRRVQLSPGKKLFTVDFYTNDGLGEHRRVAHPERILFTALNPQAGEICGRSLLQGLPFVSDILLKIFHALGKNYERAGNIRYAVTYQPGNDLMDRAYAKERAEQIAKAWQDGMRAAAHGEVKDFVAAGDVQIKVIGGDYPLMETEVPVRQMLEQITAKLGIPPFLLGLHWSTSERMSKQQTDILIAELWHYRRLLTPVIETVCTTYLQLMGIAAPVTVEWDTINLQDETESAQADYYRAQAESLRAAITNGGEG